MTEIAPPTTVCILGSTGSVGSNTLKVIENNAGRYRVVGLSAWRNVDTMLAQCLRHQPSTVVMVDEHAANDLRGRLQSHQASTRVLSGHAALTDLASSPAADCVMAAIVGAAGLPSLVAAVDAGKRVLIANKEPLVMMGAAIIARAEASGAQLLPIDSEHNAIFQCLYPAHSDRASSSLPALGGVSTAGIERVLLTGSGGPFRQTDASDLASVTPEQAVKHPNWSMGPKISVDSATLMNKGLEHVEAIHLFSLSEDQIEVVIHPQSVIHSMVEYRDGSIMASLASPDMRVPIAHALAWPERIDSGATRLDFTTMNSLHFEEPDLDRFPCLKLARDAARIGGTTTATLNAANEVAVAAFLGKTIGFMDISRVVEETLSASSHDQDTNLDAVMACDRAARQVAETVVGRFARQ